MSTRVESDPLVEALRARIGAPDVLPGLADRLARAHDASIYRIVPRVVVRPRDVDDVRALFSLCREHRTGVTFRAAGTSLSGQAVGSGVLAELGTHWRKVRISADGAFITAEPGVTGGRLNALLARHSRRIGPDPASLASAMLGGIVANNASGMCCGTHDNAYQTLEGLKVVLADGFVLDTAAPDADAALARERPGIHSGLAALRERLLSRPELLARVRKKHAIKNTMGYGLNALADFERPVDVLSHLLVGSEGTLGFLAEITLRTVVEEPLKATGLAFFSRMAEACSAVEGLAAGGAEVLELLDRSSLAALASEFPYPFALTPDCAALLIELHDADRGRLASRLAAVTAALPESGLLAPLLFTEDPSERDRYWRLRKGLLPKIGAGRRPGTAVIIEDVCFPRARLAEAVADLRAAFFRHGFGDAVIFGHAKDGNLHFVLCNDFSRPEEVERYAALMDDLAALVVGRYDGSLKAEHGTGRNMAPFVGFEWGEELHGMMREVKRLLDPAGILNPGVLLTEDPRLHLRDLKTMPPISARVDQCIECGFCERVCPSRDLSLTPRQRIALQRELARPAASGEARAALERDARAIKGAYAYAGIETCAGDGLCASVCPVGIDTGAFMRELRVRSQSALGRRIAKVAARRIAWLAFVARMGLRAANSIAAVIGRLPFFPERIPLPAAARPRPLPRSEQSQHLVPSALLATPALESPAPRVVSFSACLGAVMDGPQDAVTQTLSLCGFQVIPAARGTLCCGQAFLSKAYEDAARVAAEKLVDALWDATERGTVPVVCDTSPCTARLWSLGETLRGEDLERWRALEIFDFPSFMARRVLPLRKHWPRLGQQLILHPTCSSIKHGTVSDLVTVARTFASEVEVPISAGCCGFAGDKGFRVPELTLTATREEGAEVRVLAEAWRARGVEPFAYSTCQTCAYGLQAATGIEYRSVAHLCLEALRSEDPVFWQTGRAVDRCLPSI